MKSSVMETGDGTELKFIFCSHPSSSRMQYRNLGEEDSV